GGGGGVTADTTPPSVPPYLNGSAASPTQINLAWGASTDNVGVTGYYVYLNNAILANVGNATSYSHTGLTPSTTYNYRVSAYDAVPNHSAWTNVVSATTSQIMTVDMVAPSVPTGLAATNITGTSVTLSWKTSTDNVAVAGYV